MFYKFKKNSNIIFGVLLLITLLFKGNTISAIDNTPQSHSVFSIIKQHHSVTPNLQLHKSLSNVSSIKTPRERRKYGLNETYMMLVAYNKVIAIFRFNSSITIPENKKYLLPSTVALSLLRAPPAVF
jgi:hypothetical protein